MATLFFLIICSATFSIFLISVLPEKYGLKSGLLTLTVGAILGFYLISTYWNHEFTSLSFSWFTVGEQRWNFEILFDSLTVMMISLVSLIGALVYWFSMTYLKEEEGKRRYFILLSLFLLSMYGLVISGNLFQLFFFWELVGFCSFGLIGFYHKKKYAASAASKAFLVNRVADLFIVIGLGLIFIEFNSLSLSDINGRGQISFYAGLCLLIGASGKSAQYPFAIWLPDAMAGPTPVSAFIHAATMVTAGIILLARVIFVLPQEILMIMAFLGAVTAFLAAMVALVQHDIKKVLAFSTISQLGYMFIGLGTGAWDASLFHLFTHAFFKAGLFLNSGAVILWMKSVQKSAQLTFDVQDMRNMGGLKKYSPVVFISFTICTLALIGVPFFSGFLSKDAIISGSFAWASTQGSFLFYLVPDLAFITVVLTAIYMVRMWSLMFLGSNKVLHAFPEVKLNIQKIDFGVKFSLGILAMLSIGFIVSINPFDLGSNWIMPALRDHLAFSETYANVALPQENHFFIAGISVALILIGATFAWWKYKPSGRYHGMYAKYDFQNRGQRIAYNHYYLNDAYTFSVALFIRSGVFLKKVEERIIDGIINSLGVAGVVAGHAVKLFDKYIIDGIINFSALFAAYLGGQSKRLSAGQVQGQIIAATLMFILLLVILMF